MATRPLHKPEGKPPRRAKAYHTWQVGHVFTIWTNTPPGDENTQFATLKGPTQYIPTTSLLRMEQIADCNDTFNLEFIYMARRALGAKDRKAGSAVWFSLTVFDGTSQRASVYHTLNWAGFISKESRPHVHYGH